MKFTVMSRLRAKDYTFSAAEKLPYLMISINDANALPNMFKQDHMMRGLCILHFNDVEQGGTAMSTNDAHKILDRINTCVDHVEEIIVHCGAGVSRSAGVCAAIMQILTNDDAYIFNNAQYRPNMHCYRTVLDAYFGHGCFGMSKTATQRYPNIDRIRAELEKNNSSNETQELVSQHVETTNQANAQQKNMQDKMPYAICVKKVADVYGKPLPIAEYVYEYAQIGPLACIPDWGSEDGAMRFATDTEAAAWYRKNKESLLKFKQQYDWTTLAIRQVSYSYVALTGEDPEPEELTLEQAKEILFGKQEEANEAADNAAAGYDEGFYVGLSEGYEKALEILNKIKM